MYAKKLTLLHGTIFLFIMFFGYVTSQEMMGKWMLMLRAGECEEFTYLKCGKKEGVNGSYNELRFKLINLPFKLFLVKTCNLFVSLYWIGGYFLIVS